IPPAALLTTPPIASHSNARSAGMLPGSSTTPPSAKDAGTPTLLLSAKSNFDKHQETDNIDFYYEHNLPKLLSREGPKVTIGDIDGDSLADIYIGGTAGHP